jgi:hypothetical protein
LALEIDEIRGQHLSEASEIARRVIASRPAELTFTFDQVLLAGRSFQHTTSGEDDVPIVLMRSLAKAGRRVKQVFAAVHGEGMAWFNVVPELSNDDEVFARTECAGLVRRLSTESRQFAFSASLAAELLPELTWGHDTDLLKSLAMGMGVLYKVVHAAAQGYIDTYFQSVERSDLGSGSLGAQARPDTSADPVKTSTHEVEREEDKIKNVYEAQTTMMDVQSGLIAGHSELKERQTEFNERLKRLEEEWRDQTAAQPTPDSIDAECKAVLQKALGPGFDRLADETKGFMQWAERCYTHPRGEGDFTTAVVFLTKAFEFEFRCRVIEPLVYDLQHLIITDSTFRGDLSRFTLGEFLRFFQKHPLRTEPLLDRIGLRHQDVCAAIALVNKEKDVKHTSSKTREEATKFRAAFLGKQSPLLSLLPRP